MTGQRSSQWYEGTDRNAYLHRAWMRRGLPDHAVDGRPAPGSGLVRALTSRARAGCGEGASGKAGAARPR